MKETEAKEASSTESRYWERLLLLFNVISTVCILGWLMRYSHYGIDFTDEGNYLVWMSDPFIYDWSTSQFGFIYHALYQLLDGNIPALRQVNILITYCLAWLLVNTFLVAIAPNNPSGKLQRLVLSAGFATASLVFVDSWLPTPSYNSLALQALLLAATGLLLAKKEPSCSSMVGWALIGVGGWLAFMAKPTTAGGLGVCAGLYLALAGKINLRLLLIAVMTSIILLVMSAYYIDGSIVKFIDRMNTGVEYLGYLGGGYTFSQTIRLDDFHLKTSARLIFILAVVGSYFSVRLYCADRKTKQIAGLVLSVVFLCVIMSITFDMARLSVELGRFKGMLIWSVPFAAAALGLASYRRNLLSKVPPSAWVIALAFSVLPHVYALGTNRNYWENGSWAGLFWLLAGLILVAPLARSRNRPLVLLPLALVVQTITVLVIHSGMSEPYRQAQPLWQNNHLVEFGRPGTMLVLSEEYAKYIQEATTSARQAGFEVGTPIIDLSGQSPGILYALQAESVGRAWIIGNYPGSLRLATAALKHVPCEKIVAAWILVEPDGPRSIPNELLEIFGANLAEHYEQVSSWKTARGAGGYQEQRQQILMMPIRDKESAVQDCNFRKHGVKG